MLKLLHAGCLPAVWRIQVAGLKEQVEGRRRELEALKTALEALQAEQGALRGEKQGAEARLQAASDEIASQAEQLAEWRAGAGPGVEAAWAEVERMKAENRATQTMLNSQCGLSAQCSTDAPLHRVCYRQRRRTCAPRCARSSRVRRRCASGRSSG